jgi:hypothetical protein
MGQRIETWRNYEKYNSKPGLQVTVHEAKGSKAEQARIEALGRLGRMFDEANNPKLAPSTRIKKLRKVRNEYSEAGFDLMARVTADLMKRIQDKAG